MKLTNSCGVKLSGAIATADPGDVSKWDAVITSAGSGDPTYQTIVGSPLGKKVAARFGNVGGGAAELRWTTQLGTKTETWLRFYLYMTAFPASNLILVEFDDNVLSRSAVLQIGTTGLLRLIDASNTVKKTFTNAIALNQWIRIEYHTLFSTTVGQLDAKLFNSAQSTSPTEAPAAVTDAVLGANTGRFRIGAIQSTGNFSNIYVAYVELNDTGYPGPVVLPALPPLATMGVGR